jgi:hypothetical protein
VRLRNPLEELARLELKEATELIKGLGVQPTEHPPGAGEPVGAGITEVGPSAERVGGDVPCLHDLVDPESYHGKSFGLNRAASGLEPSGM